MCLTKILIFHKLQFKKKSKRIPYLDVPLSRTSINTLKTTTKPLKTTNLTAGIQLKKAEVLFLLVNHLLLKELTSLSIRNE